jgi:hypothetical protein
MPNDYNLKYGMNVESKPGTPPADTDEAHARYGFESGRSAVSMLSRLRERVCHHPAITATSSPTKPLIAPKACGSPLRRIAHRASPSRNIWHQRL